MKNQDIKFPFFQSEDSSSLQSIGFALQESASPCSTSPSLASTASPSAFAKLLVSTSPWSVLQEKYPKLKLQQVGLLMGVSSLLGFLGSVAFPLLRAKLGTPFTALIGSLTSLYPSPKCNPLLRSVHPGCVRRNLFNLHLSPLLPVHDRDRGRDDQHGPGLKRKNIQEDDFHCNAQVCMFVSGLTAARFGLHLFDLCVIQLFQEGVRANVDGSQY